MTIDVNVLRERLRGFADQAGEKARVCREAGNMEGAHFETGRQAAFVTALSQITLSEMDAARERDAALEHERRDKLVTQALGVGPGETLRIELAEDWDEEEDAVRGDHFSQGVNLSAMQRLEDFARSAGGAVDMASGAVYSDADGGL